MDKRALILAELEDMEAEKLKRLESEQKLRIPCKHCGKSFRHYQWCRETVIKTNEKPHE